MRVIEEPKRELKKEYGETVHQRSCGYEEEDHVPKLGIQVSWKSKEWDEASYGHERK
ncbi:MAG: hypothetical protein VX513_03885 [Pseudomonadota bacterium]|nr:hypothetical protein [Pseudomonadota bacterium]